MSTAATDPAMPAATDTAPAGGSLIRRQISGILRLELRRNLLGRRSMALYLLAFSPVLLFLVWAVTFPVTEHFTSLTESIATIFAAAFVGYLRTVVFLGTLILFMSLFRSEILQRSLHYYYLTPVRREVLVASKYFAALITGSLVFAVSTTAMFLLTCLPWGLGELSRYLFSGPGLGHLIAYVGITTLACAGYGAVFLLVGLFFRNPVVPAALIWGWELINFVLPPLLKKLSVIYYLHSLYPIPLPEGFIAVAADPTPVWITVPGLLIFTALVLAVASWRARGMEISYGDD